MSASCLQCCELDQAGTGLSLRMIQPSNRVMPRETKSAHAPVNSQLQAVHGQTALEPIYNEVPATTEEQRQAELRLLAARRCNWHFSILICLQLCRAHLYKVLVDAVVSHFHKRSSTADLISRDETTFPDWKATSDNWCKSTWGCTQGASASGRSSSGA